MGDDLAMFGSWFVLSSCRSLHRQLGAGSVLPRLGQLTATDACVLPTPEAIIIILASLSSSSHCKQRAEGRSGVAESHCADEVGEYRLLTHCEPCQTIASSP